MKPCVSGVALTFKTFGKRSIGFCATYVDDTFHVRSQQYCQISIRTE